MLFNDRVENVKKIKNFLSKNYSLKVVKKTNPIIFKASCYKFLPRQVFYFCELTKKTLVIIQNPNAMFSAMFKVDLDELFFTKTSHLDKKSFDNFYIAYNKYLHHNLTEILDYTNVIKQSDSMFKLVIDKNSFLNKGNVINNYINYLNLMRIIPTFKPNTQDYNPLSNYEVSFGYSNSYYTYTFLDKPIDDYILIYEKNSEFFIKIGLLFDLMSYSPNYTDFKDDWYDVYGSLCHDFELFNQVPHIQLIESKVDIYYTVNLSKASDSDWQLLYNLPF